MQDYAASVTVTYTTFMREEVWYRVKMNELRDNSVIGIYMKSL